MRDSVCIVTNGPERNISLVGEQFGDNVHLYFNQHLELEPHRFYNQYPKQFRFVIFLGLYDYLKVPVKDIIGAFGHPSYSKCLVLYSDIDIIDDNYNKLYRHCTPTYHEQLSKVDSFFDYPFVIRSPVVAEFDLHLEDMFLADGLLSVMTKYIAFRHDDVFFARNNRYNHYKVSQDRLLLRKKYYAIV
jgi:hypothetical protein